MSGIVDQYSIPLQQLSRNTYSYRFKLTAEIKKDFLRIDFKGYFTENFAPKNRSYSNPINDFCRNKSVDYRLFWYKR